MTDNEIIDECGRKLVTGSWVWPNITWRRLGAIACDESEGAKSAILAHEYLWGSQAAGALGSILQEAEEHHAADILNCGVSLREIIEYQPDGGDETDTKPINEVYAPEVKTESEEEKQIRLWNAVVAASQG